MEDRCDSISRNGYTVLCIEFQYCMFFSFFIFIIYFFSFLPLFFGLINKRRREYVLTPHACKLMLEMSPWQPRRVTVFCVILCHTE